MGVRFYIKDLPDDKALGIISDGENLLGCAFTDQFIEWCKEQNIDARYYTLVEKPLSRVSRRVIDIPVSEASLSTIQNADYEEDSIAFDDEAALLFKMTWL